MKPVYRPELKRVASITNLAQLQDEVARPQTDGIGALFLFTSSQDDKRQGTQVIGLTMARTAFPTATTTPGRTTVRS